MEGIVDVYEEYFINLVEPLKVHFFKKNRHTCLICREEPNKNGSYGKSDRTFTEKIIVEYLEHLKVFGFSNNLAQVFINSIRDSGILCGKVKGYWEFKEHEKYYVFIIEHCLDLSEIEIEIPKIVSSLPTQHEIEIEKYPEEKIKLEIEEEEKLLL